jgi:hypothetical protein
VASVSESDAEKRTTTPSRRATAISANCTPRRVIRPRSTATSPLRRAASLALSAYGSDAISADPTSLESAPTVSVGGDSVSIVSTATREFVATETTVAVDCQPSEPAPAEKPAACAARGTADFSSPLSFASTSRFSSEGATIRYAASRAPPTITSSAIASRTMMPPGSLTGRDSGSRRLAR